MTAESPLPPTGYRVRIPLAITVVVGMVVLALGTVLGSLVGFVAGLILFAGGFAIVMATTPEPVRAPPRARV